MSTVLPDDAGALAARCVALAEGAGGRVLVGIAGPPGSGKSTLAARVVDALRQGGPGCAPVPAVLVPMDGFHLADAALVRLGRRDRKGAPDTFDAAGFVALLARLRDGADETVWAPEFHREIEDAVAGAIEVDPHVRVVVVEGNYLLGAGTDADDPWLAVRPLLDDAWFVEVPDEIRLARLVARHVAHGRPAAAATAWAHGPDEANARLVAAAAHRADVVVRLA